MSLSDWAKLGQVRSCTVQIGSISDVWVSLYVGVENFFHLAVQSSSYIKRPPVPQLDCVIELLGIR